MIVPPSSNFTSQNRKRCFERIFLSMFTLRLIALTEAYRVTHTDHAYEPILGMSPY